MPEFTDARSAPLSPSHERASPGTSGSRACRQAAAHATIAAATLCALALKKAKVTTVAAVAALD